MAWKWKGRFDRRDSCGGDGRRAVSRLRSRDVVRGSVSIGGNVAGEVGHVLPIREQGSRWSWRRDKVVCSRWMVQIRHVPVNAVITSKITGRSVRVKIRDYCRACDKNRALVDMSPWVFVALGHELGRGVTRVSIRYEEVR